MVGDNPGQPADPREPPSYQIRIVGRLDASWAGWFDGLTIALDGGDTLLTGPVVDRAALHGLLRRVRDLGLTLVSVTTLDRGSAGTTSPAVPASSQVPPPAKSRAPRTASGPAAGRDR
jgi:hypothetical protein